MIKGDEKETAATNGFFMTADHKPVKVAKTSKKDVKKFAKDNRDGQRERKRHAKAVYGQNLIGILKKNAKFTSYQFQKWKNKNS